MTATTTCNCNGTGRLTYEDQWHPDQPAALCSALCECRKNLPRRHGKAAWWLTENVKTLEWSAATGASASATIDLEVPVSEDNYPLIRTEDNVYFPALANVALDCPSYGMTSDDLRQLAKWLTEVADECDRIDEPTPCPERA